MKPTPFLVATLSLTFCSPLAFADRRKADPPGHSKKVTRVDYEEDSRRESELDDEEEKYKEREDDDDDEKERKQSERDRIAAARVSLRNEIRNRRNENPKDYSADAKKEGLSADDKRKSSNEVELTEPVVTRPVTRRRR